MGRRRRGQQQQAPTTVAPVALVAQAAPASPRVEPHLSHALAVDLLSRGVIPHPQGQCALFSVLPAEIRNRIFYLTLLEYNDETAPVSFDSYGFRPGHEFRKKHSLDLLQTCKRAYLEAYLIPVATTTHVSWNVWNSRAPLDRSLSAVQRFSKMNVEQRAAIHTVHMYAQQCELEPQGWEHKIITNDQRTNGVLPNRLVITVRHTDWWSWENDAGLNMSQYKYGPHWRQGFKAFPALEEFVMELETLERRKAEMDLIAQEVKKWKIDVGNGRVLTTDGIQLKTHTWNGSTQHCGGMRAAKGATFLPYYVVTITWRLS